MGAANDRLWLSLFAQTMTSLWERSEYPPKRSKLAQVIANFDTYLEWELELQTFGHSEQSVRFAYDW